MGCKNRTTQLSVIDLLEKQPQIFSYEQCISILEKKYNTRFKSVSYFSDTIITCSNHTLSLSAYEISNVDISNDNAKIYAERMSITSLNGPLPSIYTEQIHGLKWVKNSSLSDFMNVFINRLSCLSYKISVRIHPSLQKQNSIDTNIGQCLNALIGNRHDQRLLQYAYMFWTMPHSALGLRLIISNYFGVNVTIEQFSGAFTKIYDVTKLALQNSILGENALLGESYFDHSNAIKIVLGPLDNSQFDDFLPGNKWDVILRQLIESYLDKNIDYSIELIPKFQQSSKLGYCTLNYNTWIACTLTH